jgi:hypothetical protein
MAAGSRRPVARLRASALLGPVPVVYPFVSKPREAAQPATSFGGTVGHMTPR